MWTSDLLPDLSPKELPIVYSDLTMRLRADDARALGQVLKDAFTRVLRVGLEEDDAEERHYFQLVALLPLDEG